MAGQPKDEPLQVTIDQSLPAYMQGTGPMTRSERAMLARDFINKWGSYFQQAYKQPLDRWAVKQGEIIGRADPDNLRNAMGKQTLEAAMMAMRGQNISDDHAINYIAARQEAGMVGPMALGDLAADLVFTPLPPCRIFDTRNTVGALASGGTKNFDTYPFGAATNFAYQGGTASGNCGMDPSAAAVMLNIAAPIPAVGGFLTVYPYGTGRPLASNLDYMAGELKNNEIVAKSANGTYDLTVYAHGSTNVVGDVVGYFIRPEATALACNNKTAPMNIANGATQYVSVACDVGYTSTGGGCNPQAATNIYMVDSYPSGNGWGCRLVNFTGAPATGTAYARCCRVPGR